MSGTGKESETNPEGLTLDIVSVIAKPTWEDTFTKLASGDAREFLRRTAAVELYDYTPLDERMQKLTNLVHEKMGEKVKVIPRGSYVSRTALTTTADLDVDLLIPEDYLLEKKSIKDWLGVKPDVGTILFEKTSLVKVLNMIWNLLKSSASSWLELTDASREFTRSIPARTKDKIKYIGDRKLEIDLFVKVLSKRGPYEYIVGVDKDGPDQLRRITTTEYIPTEGKWIGDRTLPPAERMAIIMLKWWKSDLNVPVKSHHLLSALNALIDLNQKDSLWLPTPVSTPYSNLRTMEIMRGILIYLNWTYLENPCSFMLARKDAQDKEIKDYPFPDVSRALQDKLFIQFNQDDDGKSAANIKKNDQLAKLEKRLAEACDKLRKKKTSGPAVFSSANPELFE